MEEGTLPPFQGGRYRSFKGLGGAGRAGFQNRTLPVPESEPSVLQPKASVREPEPSILRSEPSVPWHEPSVLGLRASALQSMPSVPQLEAPILLYGRLQLAYGRLQRL